MGVGEQVEVVRAGEGWGQAGEGEVKVVECDPGRGGGVVNGVRQQEVLKGIS